MLRNKRTFYSLVLAMILVCSFALPVSATTAPEENVLPFSIDAASAILIDAGSGQVIAEKNADERKDIAGAIKIMSALIVAEAVENDELGLEADVHVSFDAAKVGGMSAFLAGNETYKAKDLLKVMLQVSANDATMALAEKVAGSTEAFVAKMNENAKKMGISPVFVNPTGHNAKGQSMSAREAAVIARELVKKKNVLNYSAIYMDRMTHPGGRETELVNPNKLVRFYNGCDGLATGSNNETGYSGIFTAKRGESRYIAVVIGAKNNQTRSSIAQKLLDHAFASFKSVKVTEAGKVVAQGIKVTGGNKKVINGIAAEDYSLLTKKGEEKQLKKQQVIKEDLTAPIKKGDVIGELVISNGDTEIWRVPIISAEDVESVDIGSSFMRFIKNWLGR